MGILGTDEIRKRLQDIFSGDSAIDDCIQEASYDLRVADDLMKIGKKIYERGDHCKGRQKIEPGEIALLSTMETFDMPTNLVGRIGIKFRYTRQGLSPLFGFQVDPYYGRGYPDERLYLWVSNLGPNAINFKPGDRVFNIEFHTVTGTAANVQGQREYLAPIIEKEAWMLGESTELGFVDTIRRNLREESDSHLREATREIETSIRAFNSRLDAIEGGTRQIVTFGVFLVAAALLAGSISAFFAFIFSLQPVSQTGNAFWTNSFNAAILIVGVLLAGALTAFILVIWRHFRNVVERGSPNQ